MSDREQEVYDRHGNRIVTKVVPDGGAVRRQVLHMDSATAVLARAAIDDALRSIGAQMDRPHGIVPIYDRVKLHLHLDALAGVDAMGSAHAASELRALVAKYHYAAEDMTQPAAWRGAMMAIGDHIEGALDGALALRKNGSR